MSKNNPNSLKGVSKKHSIMRNLIPLLEGLLENTPVNAIGIGRIVLSKFPPVEPIEVRGFNTYGNKHNIRIRAYDGGAHQNLLLYCPKEKFPAVMDYILKYCERKLT